VATRLSGTLEGRVSQYVADVCDSGESQRGPQRTRLLRTGGPKKPKGLEALPWTAVPADVSGPHSDLGPWASCKLPLGSEPEGRRQSSRGPPTKNQGWLGRVRTPDFVSGTPSSYRFARGLASARLAGKVRTPISQFFPAPPGKEL
jgi:hypothetical protein